MKAIILAAGRGTRLGDLTIDKPKCMLNFGFETILERQIRILQECGFKSQNIMVVTGYRKDTIKIDPNIELVINREYDKTSNTYSLFLALSKIKEDVLILDGDLIFQKETILMMMSESGNAVCGRMWEGNDSTGITYNQETNRIEAIGKHIISDIAYASIMMINRNYIKKFCMELGKLENRKTWYTVSMNDLLNLIPFFLKITSDPIIGIKNSFDYTEAKRRFGIEDFTILLTGASGLLGKKIYHVLKREFDLVGIKGKGSNIHLPSIDITDEKTVAAFIKLNNPKVIIHTAGIADPDVCEKNPEWAYDVNVKAVQILVNISKNNNIKLIHISTDYVFDGENNKEFEYDSERVPKNYYGVTKLKAEDIVKTYSNSLIIRIPIIYGYNDDFDKETFPISVINNLEKGIPMSLDNWQIRYPVLIDDVAVIIKRAMAQTGVIHVTSRYPVTKYTWAKIIAKEFGLNEHLIQESNLNQLTNRPKHVKLKTGKNDYTTLDVQQGIQILKNQIHCVYKLIYEKTPTESVHGLNIAQYRYEMGYKLGKVLPEDMVKQLDYVMPIPNSGLYYAMGVAEAIKVPYLQGIIKQDSAIRSFQLTDLSLRERTIGKNLFPIPDLIRGKQIALVDEAIFTGTTLRIVCDMIKACQAKKIFICIPTPVCSRQCEQYILPERELLSQNVEMRELKNYFGVEEVYFQPYCNFVDSVQNMEYICYKCFRE